MQFSDYRCKNCGKVFEHCKESFTESFPSELCCPDCGSKSVRVFSGINFAIAQGKLGDSKNGYSNGITYHPNDIVGKVKGKKVK